MDKLRVSTITGLSQINTNINPEEKFPVERNVTVIAITIPKKILII